MLKGDKCMVCGSSQTTALKGYEQHYLTRCQRCSFVFASRHPTDIELSQHYETYTRANWISPITIKRYRELLQKMEPFRRSNNILDIGCGDGYFLLEAKKRNWNVYGTEFTDEAVRVCREKEIIIHKGSVKKENYAPEFFDVITSFEVIEHLNTPDSEVETYRAILRTGGLVYVTTPNFNSISRDILKADWSVIEYPEHLCYYTRKTLRRLFEYHGFRHIKTTVTGVSISRLGKDVSSHPAKKYDESLRRKTESNCILAIGKRFVNFGLNFFAKGDALKAWFVKM
jgi:2-polyprenyl-3-methyl-5-hydroxy-6-metoxy-1,4-benzoquinol methylase